MQNLAGVDNCDEVIKQELNRAGIPQKTIKMGGNAVPFTIVGELGDFKFVRHFNFWVVGGGLVPLYVAQKFYDDEYSKKVIRIHSAYEDAPPERCTD